MRSLILSLAALGAAGLLAAGCKHKDTQAKPPSPQPTASGLGKGKGSAAQPAQEPRLPPAERAKVLAKIDDTQISLGQFEDRIMRQSPYIRHRYSSRQRKKQFLDNMIRFELMAKEAMAKGYDKHPDVLRTMKQVMIQKLIRNDFEKKLKPKDIPDSELQEYYDKHKRQYNTPEQVRASHILVKFPPNATAAQKATAKARAEAVLKEVMKSGKSAKGFADLAKKHSDDRGSKRIGGDLRYFSRTEQGGTMVKEFSDAAFKLAKRGDISPLVQTRYGYHIIRLTDKRPARNRAFAVVKRQIRNRVYRQKRTKMFDDFVKSLKAKAKITVNEDLLDMIKISSKPMTRPRFRHRGFGMPGMGPRPGMRFGRPGMGGRRGGLRLGGKKRP